MSQPILVFDSGVGGLSVLQEIKTLLPCYDYVYLFDNVRLPYGELEEQELITGCINLITEVASKINAIMVVIACNTASTLVLPKLRQVLSIPVVGVVPAIKPATRLTTTHQIGLLATPGTIKRSYTKKLIDDFAVNSQVHLFGSSELVMLAEKKMSDGMLDMHYLTQLLMPISQSNIDVLVLGCTHFPLIRKELQQCLGNKIVLLDSGKAVAQRVQFLLNSYSSDKNLMVNLDPHKKIGRLEGCYTTKNISRGLTKSLIEFGFNNLISLYPNNDHQPC